MFFTSDDHLFTGSVFPRKTQSIRSSFPVNPLLSPGPVLLLSLTFGVSQPERTVSTWTLSTGSSQLRPFVSGALKGCSSEPSLLSLFSSGGLLQWFLLSKFSFLNHQGKIH